MRLSQFNTRALLTPGIFTIALILIGFGGCPQPGTDANVFDPNALGTDTADGAIVPSPGGADAGGTSAGTVNTDAGTPPANGGGSPGGAGPSTLPPPSGTPSPDDPAAGDAPVVDDLHVLAPPDAPIDIELHGTSALGRPLAFEIVTPPASGSLSEIAPVDDLTATVTFTPAAGFRGQAQFSYWASDGTHASNVGTVSVLVYPPVYFALDVYEGDAPLTVVGQAFTMTGDPLPDAEYRWSWGDLEEGGPVATFGQRAHTFVASGTYAVGFSILLAGVAQPIGCAHSRDGKQSQFAEVAVTTPSPLVVSADDGQDITGDAGGPFAPDSKTYTLTNTSRARLDWTATPSEAWLTLSATSGSLEPAQSAPVTVSLNSVANTLTDGSYNSMVTFANVTNGKGSTTRSVGVAVGQSSALAVSPSSDLTSSGNAGGPISPSSTSYTLTNSGKQVLSWTATKMQSWVTLSAASGALDVGASTTVMVSINANANSLTAGSYSDTVSFTNTTNGQGNTTRGVGLTVAQPAALAVSPAGGLSSSGNSGGPFSPSSTTYTLTNTGGQSINWTAAKTQSWVTLSAASGSLAAGASTTVSVSVNSGTNSLAAGSFSDTVSFTNTTNGSGNGTRPVSLTVSAAPGALSSAPAGGLSSSGAVGGLFSPTSISYTLTNNGGQALSWTASKTQSWVTLSKSSGTLAAGGTDTVTVSINAGANSLAVGSFSDTVTFTNTTNGQGNTTRAVALTVVQPATLAVSPADGLSSSGNSGGPFSPSATTYTLTNNGGQALSWTAAKTQSWVTLSAASGSLAAGASTTVTVSLNPGANSLAAGNYSDTATFANATNATGTTTRSVALTVATGLQMASSVSQYGITWTFDKPYQVGQFVTGDWWVVGPVTIVSVTPAPLGTGASYRNGSMVNPSLANGGTQSTYQAYDGRIDGFHAADVVTYPLSLDPSTGAESLISTESIPAFPFDVTSEPDPFPAAYRTRTTVIAITQQGLRNAAILTVVSEVPSPSAFRPPFVGTTKTVYDASTLQTELLPQLAVPAHAPNLAVLERCLQRPWIDAQKRNWMADEIAPINNQVSYGREFALVVGDAALALCLNYTDSQKDKILKSLVQLGVDHYYAAQLDAHLWPTNGGYRHGRKLPILFAGLMLDDPNMLSVAADFQEDMATYYGSDRDPEQTLWTGWAGQPKPYEDVGSNNVLYQLEDETDTQGHSWDHEGYAPTAWASSPFPNNNSPEFYPWGRHEGYRRLVSYSWVGEALAARILGLRTAWNHDPFFDYVDRWMNEDDAANRAAVAAAAVAGNWNALVAGRDWTNPVVYYPFGGSCLSQFQKDMYLMYRPEY
jgi:hypothetical protein